LTKNEQVRATLKIENLTFQSIVYECTWSLE